MKKSVNLNYIWSKFFVEQLASHGLRNVCISPGSRSTPLVAAFAENKKINKYVIVDERSSAFFALGLAKQSGLPAAVVTTSGTATANLYPAIIEAFQSRVPLIICTADRPNYLRNTGSNQTINQDNLYKNHIRFFAEIGLPKGTITAFKTLNQKLTKAYWISLERDRGPVHLNFPFEKPLEKSSPNILLDDSFFDKLKGIHAPKFFVSKSKSIGSEKLKPIVNKINSTSKGMIFVGWDNYDTHFIPNLLKLSERTNFPILADGASGIFLKSNHPNVIVNHQAFLKSEKFVKNNSPKLVLQFGNAPTSNAMLDFLRDSNAYKIAVNEFGDSRDPSRTFKKAIEANAGDFCMQVSNKIKFKTDNSFLSTYQHLDKFTEEIKSKYFRSIKISDEIGIVNKVIDALPNNFNLFVSNSLPIRDLEFFKSKTNKKMNLFVNRGASGIDGINSTAAGIASSSNKPAILITGDLSFFHDTNGLHAIVKYKIPITIILINNGGGAIFGMLPISKENKIFNDYFFTSLNLDFSKLVNTFGGKYYKINSYNSLSNRITESIKSKSFSILEIKTDYKKGIELRKDYFRKVISEIENMI